MASSIPKRNARRVERDCRQIDLRFVGTRTQYPEAEEERRYEDQNLSDEQQDSML